MFSLDYNTALLILLAVNFTLIVGLVFGGIAWGVTTLSMRFGPRVLANVTTGITMFGCLFMGAFVAAAFHAGTGDAFVKLGFAGVAVVSALAASWVAMLGARKRIKADFDAINELVALRDGIFDVFDDDKDHVISPRDLRLTAKRASKSGRVSPATVRWLQRNFHRVGHSTGSGIIITANDPVFAQSRFVQQFSAWEPKP